MKKQFDVLYYKDRNGTVNHQYTERWAKTEVYCPRCGKQEVFANSGGGDYYTGEQHICTACKGTFCFSDGVTDVKVGVREDQDSQRLAHLMGCDNENL